jgi:NAD(P)-dependent dehydrogenase (short-subunit alcohol dehydrogenase family)
VSTDKIVLVTGAGRGLGESTARHLAEAGWKVVGTYNASAAAADALVAEGVLTAALRLDVSDAASFPAFVDRLRATLGDERLTAVVHNAGIGVHAAFVETTEEQLDDLYRIHVKAPFLLTQQLLPVLAGGGRILNVSSGLARFTLPGYAAYATMKGALEVLTRYQAEELGARGIRVNIIAPGAIATDFGGGAVRDVPEVNAAVAGMIPLGRVGQADDIGAAVRAILSDDLGWVNGARLEVSGGQRL